MARKPGEPIDVRRTMLALCSDVVEDRNYENQFKSNHQVLHHLFWQLSQDEETRCFVSGLLFDTNGNYPYSEEIDELLQELQLSGLLERPNPTYRYNDITFLKYTYAEELKKDLSPEENTVYNNILEAFKRELCIPVTG